MIRLSGIWYCIVIMVVIILTVDLTILFAETDGDPKPEETRSTDTTDEINPLTKVDRQLKDSSLPNATGNVDPATKVKPQGAVAKTIPTELSVDSATAVDIQRHFNELKSEYLDDRSDYIDMWLAVVAIVLTFFGVVIAVLGIVGYRKFRELESDAKESVEKIEEHLAQSKEHLGKITSIDIDDPDKATEVEKAIRDIQSDPEPSFIDKVIAEIYTLQRNGRVEKAIEKWRSVANIAEGIDNGRASEAWLSIAYLLPKGEDQFTAYNKAIDLNPDFTRDSKNQPISKHSKLFHDTIVVRAVLRYFSDPKFEKFSTVQEYIIASDRYRADVVLHDEEGQLVVIVECKVNEYVARSAIAQLREYLRRSGAQFGLLAVGTNLSKWTFFRILGGEITEITRSQFEEGVLESGSS